MLQNNKLENSFNANPFNGSANGLGTSTNINISSREVPKYILFISKYIKILIIIEVIMVFVLGYMYLVKPKFNQLTNSMAILKDKNTELSEIQNYQTKSEDLRKEYEDVKNQNLNDIKKLQNILPQEKELPELMAQIEALADRQGLILADITINNSSNVGSTSSSDKEKQDAANNARDIIREIEVSVSILGGDGTYDKVKSFLSAMENHIRLIDITSFSFDEKMTSYSVVFKTYFLKNNEI